MTAFEAKDEFKRKIPHNYECSHVIALHKGHYYVAIAGPITSIQQCIAPYTCIVRRNRYDHIPEHISIGVESAKTRQVRLRRWCIRPLLHPLYCRLRLTTMLYPHRFHMISEVSPPLLVDDHVSSKAMYGLHTPHSQRLRQYSRLAPPSKVLSQPRSRRRRTAWEAVGACLSWHGGQGCMAWNRRVDCGCHGTHDADSYIVQTYLL
jgi:hypothetical protein